MTETILSGTPEAPDAPKPVEENVEPQAPKANETEQPADLKIEPTEDPEAKAAAFLETYEKKWAENGKLEEGDYADLAKRGYPKHMVNAYIDGQSARAQGIMADAMAITGGVEGWQQLSNWAAQNLPEAEVAYFNTELGAKDANRIKMALSNLKARRDSTDPNIVSGTPSGGGVNGFASQEDWILAMKDPQYKTSPEYQEKTAQRLARSEFFKTIKRRN